MKKSFLPPIFACMALSAAFAEKSLDRFAIGAWWDPELSGSAATDENRLRDYLNGGFNILSGYGDKYSYHFSTTEGSKNITNQYLLARAGAVNQGLGKVALGVNVHEDAFATATFNPSSYTALTGNSANALYGYSVIHEPLSADLPNLLNAVKNLRTKDPSRVTFDVMASIWRVWDKAKTFAPNWTAFDTYVTQYVNHANTKIASFDYYILSEINGKTHYSPQGADRVNYYATLNLFGKRTASANKIFWGIANSDDRQIEWWDGSTHLFQEHFPFPTDANLRFNAYSQLAYGAKGMMWYTWDMPTTSCNPAVVSCETFNYSASNNPVIYGRLQAINKEMANMGPTLMRLKFVSAVHGAATDPYSGESALPIINASTPVMNNEDTHDEIAIGIHKHLDNGRNYLTFFNKDWQNSKTLWFSTKGFNDLYLFNKSTSAWTRVPQAISWSGQKTSFPLDFRPADLQLVDVRAGVINALHLYWDAAHFSHYVTANYEGSSGAHGAYQETMGGVYKTQVTGTTPLYAYANPTLYDWMYTTTYQGNNNGSGYLYQSIVGYVFPTQQAGTVPLYQYWNAAGTDHYYTTRWQGNDNGYGWTYQATVGYVIQNI